MTMHTQRPNLRFVFLIALAACLLALGFSRAASAADPSQPALTLDPIADVHAGDTVTVAAHLTSSDGQSIVAAANQRIEFRVNGQQKRKIATDANGKATYTFRPKSAGTIYVDVLFAGSDNLRPANATAQFSVKPAVLDIQIVPAIQGVQVTDGNATFTSDANGLIHIEQSTAQDVQLHLATATIDSPGEHAAFSRWFDNVFLPDRSYNLSSASSLQIGFDVSDLVSLQFVDPSSKPVEASRISEVTLTSTSGLTHSYQVAEPHWLESSRIVRRSTGLESVPIQWGVDRVVIDGQNVVNQGQQRFFATSNAQLPVRVLLFSATLSARDALFGFPIGSGFTITSPNGELRDVDAGQKTLVTLNSLVRGKYEVKVTGAAGLASVAPVDVSKDQTVRVLVLSYIDIAFGLSLGLLFAVWLLFLGRPTILHVVGIKWPQTADRRQFARAGAVAVVVVCSALVAFDVSYPGDNIPFLPENDAALAQAAQTPAAGSQSVIIQPTPASQQQAASSTAVATPTAVTTHDISPLFASFWQQNGALPVFGYAIGDQTLLDAQQGIVAQDFERQRLEFHPESVGTPYSIQLGLLGIDDAKKRGLLGTDPFRPLTASSSTPSEADCVYFDATGHSVCGVFLQFWQQHGLDFGDPGISFRESLALFGYPISEPFVDPATGLRVQYFERARFEEHPKNPNPYKVLLGRLNAGGP